MAGPSGPRQRPGPLLRTMIGEVLRGTRQAQGRTLADVSRAARVSVPYLSELERGRKEASSEVLAAICDALRIDLSELLAGVGRELAGQRAGTVIRLDAIRGGPAARPARSPVRGGGDAVCLAA
ncbi:MAG TPA: helix-turn-helix transcriptional regulator [Streptosporangiaceae bacterium]|nr:helix-turn-helix transcriptional regulator [Streptosporangiaceae bacterium]